MCESETSKDLVLSYFFELTISPSTQLLKILSVGNGSGCSLSMNGPLICCNWTSFLLVAHLLMVLEVSDDFTQHVNEAAKLRRDSCIQLVILTEVI